MSNPMLIPGNQYKVLGLNENCVYLFVGYTTDQHLVFQNLSTKAVFTEPNDTECIPYTPPVEHKRYLCWFKNSAGEVFCNILKSPWKEYKFGDNQTLLSETLVTYTEEK